VAAATSPTPEAKPEMPDQITDAVMARALHADAVRVHPLAAWVILRDPVDYPGELVARLVTDTLTPYVLRWTPLVGQESD
jgi:hypothetical protein